MSNLGPRVVRRTSCGRRGGLFVTADGHPAAQTRARFPHACIRREGQQISTLDLFGDSYALREKRCPSSRSHVRKVLMAGSSRRALWT